jgi:membrane-bound lytic murein transglycosylase MltF
MLNDDLSKVERVEVAINVLHRALQHLDEHDYTSAQVMVALVRQVLEELQLDFEQHFQAERILKQLLKQSPR